MDNRGRDLGWETSFFFWETMIFVWNPGTGCLGPGSGSFIEIDLRSGIWVFVNFLISFLNAASLEGLTAWAWALVNELEFGPEDTLVYVHNSVHLIDQNFEILRGLWKNKPQNIFLKNGFQKLGAINKNYLIRPDPKSCNLSFFFKFGLCWNSLLAIF